MNNTTNQDRCGSPIPPFPTKSFKDAEDFDIAMEGRILAGRIIAEKNLEVFDEELSRDPAAHKAWLNQQQKLVTRQRYIIDEVIKYFVPWVSSFGPMQYSHVTSVLEAKIRDIFAAAPKIDEEDTEAQYKANKCDLKYNPMGAGEFRLSITNAICSHVPGAGFYTKVLDTGNATVAVSVFPKNQ